MEYMLLITEREDHFTNFTRQQWDVLDERHRQFAKKIVDVGGEILFSDPLKAPRPQSRFTPSDEGVLVTDGPFAETKEILLGYYKIRVDSEEVARQLAAECPTAGYVDLREVGLEQ